ncbi:hypothetical protein ACFLZX_06065 [Nanoarchaeota archaeon]
MKKFLLLSIFVISILFVGCQPTCEDSDGFNPMVKGNITITHPDGRIEVYEDECNFSHYTLVTEYICDKETGLRDRVVVDCATYGPDYRCFRNETPLGRCYQEPYKPISCVDSDGINPLIKGNITLTYPDGRVWVIEDGCRYAPSVNPTLVSEYICNNETPGLGDQIVIDCTQYGSNYSCYGSEMDPWGNLLPKGYCQIPQ